MNALQKIETESPYKERFTFEIIPMSSDRGKASEALYAWGPVSHGLAIATQDGTVKGVLKGHNYERPEIIALLDEALK